MVLYQPHGALPPNEGTQSLGTIRRRVIPKRPQVRGIGQTPVLVALGCVELVAVTRPPLGGVRYPLVVRIRQVNVPERVEGLVHEYEPYQNGENLLRETSEESCDSASVAAHKNNHEQGRPHSSPEPELQERDAVHAAEGEQDLLEDEGWPGGSQDHQRLTGEDGIEEVADAHS